MHPRTQAPTNVGATNRLHPGRIIPLVSEIASRYQLSSIQPLLASVRKVSDCDELSVAVVGRFKAGKSSFLNCFLQREILPVGVVPVTTVVTEIGYGPAEKATVHFLSGAAEQVSIEQIRSFVAESENPDNWKNVSTVEIELPELARFRSLSFVDLPGLESALAHNTEAVLSWLPNVGLALVAVSVDPPLSQNDIELLKSVYRFTPQVVILLTKIDLLNDSELEEVLRYVRDQLARNFEPPPPIFPYSVRPGYLEFQRKVEEVLVGGTLADFYSHRGAILQRKLETLLRECSDYLRLALKSSASVKSEREAVKRQVIGERESLDEEKSELHLVVQHAAGSTRVAVEKRLRQHQRELKARLASEFEEQFPEWTRSLGSALKSFEHWLGKSLTEQLLAISAEERNELLAPLEKLKKQVFRSLQNFRDRLSDRTERAFGLPLRTTESEIEIKEPRSPDIHIGKVFDRNWELLSPVVPMSLFKRLVRRHFMNRTPYMIEKNLSRLTTQWDESIREAMTQILKEAQRRLDELVETVERLIATSHDDAPGIRVDLESIESILNDSLMVVARND